MNGFLLRRLRRQGLPLTLGLGLALTCVSTAALAQRSALREVRESGTAGGALLLGIPVGQFKDHVDVAGGVGGFAAFNLDRAGATSLRLDGSYLIYDNLRDVAYLSGGYVSYPVDLNTSSYIVTFRAGPQITLGQGPVRLYGFGMGGFSYFATSTSYDDACGCGGSFASATQYDDFNLAWETGGGLQIALGRGHQPVLLDLGARYLHNGRTSYVPARTLAGGSITPIVSEANLVVVQLGLSIGVR